MRNKDRIIADPFLTTPQNPVSQMQAAALPRPAMPNRRTAFFISDRTGITVEMLGNSLLTQFDVVEFRRITLPFIDNMDKARDVLNQIKAAQGTSRSAFCRCATPPPK